MILQVNKKLIAGKEKRPVDGHFKAVLHKQQLWGCVGRKVLSATKGKQFTKAASQTCIFPISAGCKQGREAETEQRHRPKSKVELIAPVIYYCCLC